MKRYCKRAIAAMLVIAAVLPAAGGPRDDFRRNIRMSANNYWAYPDTDLPRLSPAPDGYTPFFLNHYGRHGSRWLIGKKAYSFSVEQLELGEQAGKLTPRGKEVLTILRALRESAEGRDGELSDIGAEQHQGIARRMVQNFPEIFSGNATVRARSTIVVRCILSMQNEVDMLAALNPQLRITTDASKADMYYMNYDDLEVKPLRKDAYHYFDEFKQRHVKPDRFLRKIFTDAKWAKDNISGTELMIDLFDIAGNMQSHHQWENTDLYDLYSADDVYNVWSYNNVRWYIYSGETPLTRCRVDYMEANLVHNFIEDADRAIAEGHPAASLRFGHESVVLPLICLMGINGFDYQTTNLETLADHWQCYKVFPMACNLQVIYYRPDRDGGDILVKLLLNEREATLPIAAVSGPYYRWADVRQYLLNKLSRQPIIPPSIR